MSVIDCTKSVTEYVSKEDWRIKANANIGYSHGGMVNNLAGKAIANYWLDEVYSEEEGKAHRDGDYHIHDLDNLTPYCAGWSLRNLLQDGFNGIQGRVSSKPPRHFREALGQMANFLGILQTEWAGAQAFSSFDTYLAPYAFRDQLSNKELKKAVKQFVYNMNVPSRWSQCLPETTEVWTPAGFKTVHQLSRGDLIYTVNMDTFSYEALPIKAVQKYPHSGIMHRYSGRDYCQTVTSQHRLVKKKYNSTDLEIVESKDVFNDKTPATFPVAANNSKADYPISDALLEFLVFILTDGSVTVQEGKSPRLTFYKSDSRWGNERVYELAEELGLSITHTVKAGGFGSDYVCNKYSFLLAGTEDICAILNNTKTGVPSFFTSLSERQSKLVINTWAKLDGHLERMKLQCDNEEIASAMQEVALNAGYGSHILYRLVGNNKTPTLYLKVYDRKFKDAISKEEIAYSGIVWCPTTDNGTIVCRENGRVFVTGNSPFSNITLDITVPDDLKDKVPMYKNEHLFEDIKDNQSLLIKAKERRATIEALTDMTYADFVPEMERIIVAYYEIMTDGDSVGQPFTFPIPTVNITEEFKWDTAVADAIFKNTAKVGSSYFQNFIGSQYMSDKAGNKVENPEAYKPNAVRSMCCRLQLDLRELQKRGNGLFGSAELTGSCGVVTLNMARIGFTNAGNMTGLYTQVDKLCDLAKSTLEKKRACISNLLQQGFYPYTLRYLRSFKNHFSTIGVCGMNEMLLNFSGGKVDIASEEGATIASDILKHIRDKLRVYQEETGNMYNLEATPAEGTTYRFAKEDLKRFPSILQAGVYPNIYYTNSSQLPADYTDDPFTALDLQEDLQCKYTGGTVLHLYMSEKIDSTDACKKLVKQVLTSYKLPYITVTPVFSVCEEHGYLSGEQPICPTCEKATQVWSRVMGYHRPISSYNTGKQGEHKERKFFSQKKADTHLAPAS